MLAERVAVAARSFGKRAALCSEGRTLTWAELHEHAAALAEDLRPRDLRGRTVALAMGSGASWLVSAVAVNRLGGVIAGLPPTAGPAERTGLLEMLSPELVLADAATVDALPLRLDVVAVGPGLAGSPGSTDPETMADSETFAICCTSGTTGTPKAAAFTVGAARAVESIDLGFVSGVQPADVAGAGFPLLASTQFAHVGFVLKFPWYAHLGCTVHLMRRWRADDALALIERHRMTTVGVVAPQLALMLRSEHLERTDLSSVELLIAGGAPSPPALVEAAMEHFDADYSIRWSSTESGGVGLANTISHGSPVDVETLDSIGSPRPGVEARVADPTGTVLADGEVGELQLRSPATMSGYVGDPEATAEASTPDGWLRTGDLAYRRGDGRFTLAGRASDMYIRGGYNVHPMEVEGVLGRHPGVQSVAVVPRRDEVMGELGVAVVVPTDPARPPTLDDLRSHAAEHLARHKLPEALVVVEEIPLTGADKVDRRLLAGRVAHGATEEG